MTPNLRAVDPAARLRAAKAEKARREKLRRAAIASVAAFLRQSWHVRFGQKRLEWDFHLDAMCMHGQIMAEEWFLAGLEPEQVDAQFLAWEAEGRPYVADERAHWERPEDEFVLASNGAKVFGCGRGMYRQRATDLAVNVGPISLKSHVYMVVLLAWIWTWAPDFEAFCSSGTPSNVSRDSLACRDLVTSEWYRDLFHVKWEIRDDLDRIDKWGTTSGGTRESRGSGGSVTGVHADGIFLDDPDDAAKVWSESERRDIMVFWKALGNRLKDPRRPLRFIVQQNLHEEDLSTRSVAEGMPRLAIPVEFDPSKRDELYTAPFNWVDPRTRKGEELQPLRFTAVFLRAERIRLGTHGFEAQYNCNPSPLEGGLIKREYFRFFRVEDDGSSGIAPRPRPEGCVGSGGEYGAVEQFPAHVLQRTDTGELDLDWLTITVDATFGSTSDTASAVGLLVVGGKESARFVFDDRTDVMTFLTTVSEIKKVIARWPVGRVLIELKANGASVIESLQKAMREGDLKGPDGSSVVVVVEAINPEGGKESRAAAMVPEIEAGMVFLLDGAAWLAPFIGEVCVFPNGRRDDRVDALSQLLNYYRVVVDALARWRALCLR